MNIKTILNYVLIVYLSVGCSINKQSNEGLPYIDVRKNYPEKEIVMTEIADVTYLHLITKNSDYLYRGRIICITENTIVVGDDSSGSILFFSKDGQPISRLNRYGVGPEEYPMSRFSSIIYDEAKDDVFIRVFNNILVYSSSGVYKKKLTLPPGIYDVQIVSFDNQSLLVHDPKRIFEKMQNKSIPKVSDFITHYNDSSFFLISKADGKVLEYITMPSNEIDLSFYLYDGVIRMRPTYCRIVKCSEGLFLCNHEVDTVFLYGKDKSLTPVMRKIPLINKLDPMVILDNCMDTGKYQFIVTETLSWEKDKDQRKYYIRDKETGEIARQKIILPDYQGKQLFISPYNTYFNGGETLSHFELDLIELKQAYNNNRLGGKLKELVVTLNEFEDNNVFMFFHFK